MARHTIPTAAVRPNCWWQLLLLLLLLLFGGYILLQPLWKGWQLAFTTAACAGVCGGLAECVAACRDLAADWLEAAAAAAATEVLHISKRLRGEHREEEPEGQV
jgi:hypothetical protein